MQRKYACSLHQSHNIHQLQMHGLIISPFTRKWSDLRHNVYSMAWLYGGKDLILDTRLVDQRQLSQEKNLWCCGITHLLRATWSLYLTRFSQTVFSAFQHVGWSACEWMLDQGGLVVWHQPIRKNGCMAISSLTMSRNEKARLPNLPCISDHRITNIFSKGEKAGITINLEG